MKIGYLGAGTWGYCLARLLAEKGYQVKVWSIETEVIKSLETKREHPRFPKYPAPKSMSFTTDLEELLNNSDIIIEGVTSAGIRPVFEKIKEINPPQKPIILTSKGIEQNSSLLLSEVVIEILGEEYKESIGCLSGPSHAEEVIQGLPTSVACSAFNQELLLLIQQLFTTSKFRVYPNNDLYGVEFGAAMKNIIAIACGISDGLGFGDNTKAALMTRGLHEIRKLSVTKNCSKDTLNGLSGMGDLCVTCLSTHSRNYQFGKLIAEGLTVDEAKEEIGQVVEGAYTALSALQLSKKANIPLPITESVYNILFNNLSPETAVQNLLERRVKEEHL